MRNKASTPETEIPSNLDKASTPETEIPSKLDKASTPETLEKPRKMESKKRLRHKSFVRRYVACRYAAHRYAACRYAACWLFFLLVPITVPPITLSSSSVPPITLSSSSVPTSVLPIASLRAQEKPAKKDDSQAEWLSNIEVARKILARFDQMETYAAKFDIQVRENQRKRNMRGQIYYKKPNRLRYEFSQPKGNLVVADGQIMWFYIDRLKVVGKQNLVLGNGDSEQASSQIFSETPVSGLRRMFRKYHYRFDNLDQPRAIQQKDGSKISSYILKMEQRERIGGYANLKLYTNAQTMLVYKLEGDDGYGKETVVTFSDIRENPKLEGKIFAFKVESDMSVVSNPLVDSEDRP